MRILSKNYILNFIHLQLFLSKNARYFKLNNKTSRSNSTASLPPPYSGQSDSCAEALPEKAPLPEGGLQVGCHTDK